LELQGFKVGEVKVSHYPRIHGKTKYNWRRSIKGLVDMMSVWFWRKYAHRPLHLFGGSGIILAVVGTGILVWMAVEKIMGGSIAEKIWPLMGVFFIMIGVQLFVFGLMADIMIKNYYKSQKRMNYAIEKVIES
jgi:hypothetical protein